MSTRSYVWYAGYGSNLSKQRFLCYIVGGTPIYGKKCNKGCRDKRLPIEDRPCKIPHSLYFALPEGKEKTDMWGRGGVAFINPAKECCGDNWALGRMWKMSNEQYEEVKRQEGPWYTNEISFGEEDGIPINTVTNEFNLTNITRPSDAYLKTIFLGLKERYDLNDEKVAKYLLGELGIKDKFNIDELLNVISAHEKKI